MSNTNGTEKKQIVGKAPPIPLVQDKDAKFNFTPFHRRVLLRHIEKEEKTPGGIIIPMKKGEAMIPKGIIVAIAKDCEIVKVGDMVLFDPRTTMQIYHPESSTDIDYHITHEQNLMGSFG